MRKIKNKKLLLIILVVLLSCAVITGAVFGIIGIRNYVIFNQRMADLVPVDIVASSKNIILMIGDGMGFNHLEVTKAYAEIDELHMETLPIKGEMSTFSRSSITDSAAAGTAISTGYKVHNENIAYYNGNNLETITQIAIASGRKTGVVISETLLGATPTAFTSHAPSRNNTDLLFNTQIDSGVNVLMGEGKSYYSARRSLIENKGYSFSTNFNDIDKNSNKILASFDSVSAGEHSDTSPTLKEMSMLAIEMLDNENGFFLMIEGSYIDKKSHANDIMATIEEMIAFDEAVAAVLEYAISDGDTFLMVTADHETGGLQYNGETKSQISDRLFTSGGHTNDNVPYFIYGLSVTIPNKIDNTDIFIICKQLIAA